MNNKRKSFIRLADGAGPQQPPAPAAVSTRRNSGWYPVHRRIKSNEAQNPFGDGAAEDDNFSTSTETTNGRYPTHRRSRSTDLSSQDEEEGYELPVQPSIRNSQIWPANGPSSSRDRQSVFNKPRPPKPDLMTIQESSTYSRSNNNTPNGGPEPYSNPNWDMQKPNPTIQESFEKFSLQNDGSYVRETEVQPEQASSSNRRTMDPAARASKRKTLMQAATSMFRKNSMQEVYENAKKRGAEVERKRWVQLLFEYSVYFFLIAFVFFVVVGKPLWNGIVYWTYILFKTKLVISGGWAITMGIAALYAFLPLFVLFEKDPPMVEHPPDFDLNKIPGVSKTALLIPCYKAAGLIGATLEAAVKVFPPENIFVISNGNSETPLDNTEEVCQPYGVTHIWSPIGSKIVAQFVGAFAAKDFENVLLIDDDCAIPPNFPVVSDRLVGRIKCIGYTIKSVGPKSSRGTWCNQAQDLEYKLSGIQRAVAGVIGSATFPHGAISLWNRQFLIDTFYDHPGFSVSEDWFFGHSCRRLGGRITMCTAIFVETETPDAVFVSSGGERGGFGEMTVFKQRFWRWNFFFVSGIGYNLAYIFGSWKLGWWEFGAKLFVFQEVYETILYVITPLVLPICFIIAPLFTLYLFLITCAMYMINSIIFNELHLRLKGERVSMTMLLVYYLPYKLVLTIVNIVSCYYSMWKYAQYFAKPTLKITEDEKAVRVVMDLEEPVPQPEAADGSAPPPIKNNRTSVVIGAVGSRLSFMRNPRLTLMNPYQMQAQQQIWDNQRQQQQAPQEPNSENWTTGAGDRSSKVMRISFIAGPGMAPITTEYEQQPWGRRPSEMHYGGGRRPSEMPQLREDDEEEYEEENNQQYGRDITGRNARKGSWAKSMV